MHLCKGFVLFMQETEQKNTLTLRQLHALPFLLSHASISHACKECGVSEKQVWEWMNQEDFRAELYRQKNNVISRVTNKLQHASLKASETLVDLMENGKTETIKHKAAVDRLNLSLKFTQIYELEDRIKRLERQEG